jgi:hypothetical protein
MILPLHDTQAGTFWHMFFLFRFLSHLLQQLFLISQP